VLDQEWPRRRHRRMPAEEAGTVADWVRKLQPVLPGGLDGELTEVLKELIEAQEISVVCVERQQSAHCQWELAAVGTSAFIADELAAMYQSDHPFPNLNLTLLERKRVKSQEPGILAVDEIGRGNRGGGLNLFILWWIHKDLDYDFTKEHVRELFEQAHAVLVAYHVGHKVNQIIFEGWESVRDATLAVGFKEVIVFPERTAMRFPGAYSDQTLLVSRATRAECLGLPPGSIAARLFRFTSRYQPPICSFKSDEQFVLERALMGESNEEIAEVLKKSESWVRLQWRLIYGIMEDHGLIERHPEGQRGLARRDEVRDYLANHPEELRPYAYE